MMPPPGMPRPGGRHAPALVEALEATVDEQPRRLQSGRALVPATNRAEYARIVHELLALDVDAGGSPPLDSMGANFDNIAGPAVLADPPPGVPEGGQRISRLAVGDPRARHTVELPRPAATLAAPLARRGRSLRDAGRHGRHTFPADGEYVFRVVFLQTVRGLNATALPRRSTSRSTGSAWRCSIIELEERRSGRTA